MNDPHPSNRRERFDKWSSSYDSRRSRIFFARLHRRLLPLLMVEPRDSVLDVGCGTGSQALQLAYCYPDAEIHGVDFSEGMVEEARRKKPPGSKVSFSAAAVEDLPFNDCRFDLVFSTLSFHHWADRQQGIRECVRVLRPGGRLVIVDITGDGWYSRMYRLFGCLWHLSGHVPYAGAAEINAHFQAAGLEDVRQQTIWPAIVITRGLRSAEAIPDPGRTAA